MIAPIASKPFPQTRRHERRMASRPWPKRNLASREQPMRMPSVVNRAHAVSLAAIEDEIANGVTHGIGLGLSIAGLVGLIVLTSLHGSIWHIVGCTVYGASLVVLYTASTLYHAVQHIRAKQILRLVDHIAIYLLIAGTYTPFTLVNLRGPWGWTLFGIVWGLAALGAVFKLVYGHGLPWLSLTLYLAMGWVAVIAARPLFDAVPTGCLLWLLGGGLAYTVGTVFYAWDSIRYFHAVWHLFVLAGSALHYCAVIYYVVPFGS